MASPRGAAPLALAAGEGRGAPLQRVGEKSHPPQEFDRACFCAAPTEAAQYRGARDA
jgi:hypothetical protein